MVSTGLVIDLSITRRRAVIVYAIIDACQRTLEKTDWDTLDRNYGSVWESNPLTALFKPPTGFEDQGPHQRCKHSQGRYLLTGEILLRSLLSVEFTLPLSFTPFNGGQSVPRKPALRKKKVGKSVYWFTKAGGETRRPLLFSPAKVLCSARATSALQKGYIRNTAAMQLK